EDLQSSYNKVKNDIPDHAKQHIKEFIQSEPRWTLEAAELANYEWELDNIKVFFSGIKTKKVDLGTQTLQYLTDEHSETLTQDDIDYLETLSKRTSSEPNEEDMEFFENHRQELDGNRSL